MTHTTYLNDLPVATYDSLQEAKARAMLIKKWLDEEYAAPSGMVYVKTKERTVWGARVLKRKTRTHGKNGKTIKKTE